MASDAKNLRHNRYMVNLRDHCFNYKERTMSDTTADRNNQLKAAMKQRETAPPLNTGPGQVPCGQNKSMSPSDQQVMWKLVQTKRSDAPLDLMEK
jgi:hypothetical protein